MNSFNNDDDDGQKRQPYNDKDVIQHLYKDTTYLILIILQWLFLGTTTKPAKEAAMKEANLQVGTKAEAYVQVKLKLTTMQFYVR